MVENHLLPRGQNHLEYLWGAGPLRSACSRSYLQWPEQVIPSKGWKTTILWRQMSVSRWRGQGELGSQLGTGVLQLCGEAVKELRRVGTNKKGMERESVDQGLCVVCCSSEHLRVSQNLASRHVMRTQQTCMSLVSLSGVRALIKFVFKHPFLELVIGKFVTALKSYVLPLAALGSLLSMYQSILVSPSFLMISKVRCLSVLWVRRGKLPAKNLAPYFLTKYSCNPVKNIMNNLSYLFFFKLGDKFLHH